jgi:3D (Asp-Asp-Asp) domain-containing protein
MYNAVEGQCDSDPLVTAGMYKINPRKASQHKWVALSRDLLKRWGGQFDYGDTVIIENAGDKSGKYTVVDTMNPRFTNKIDILETQGTDLYKYENVKIIKIL